MKLLKRTEVKNLETDKVLYEEESCFTASMNAAGYRIPSHKEGARMFAEVDFPKEVKNWEIGCMARLAKRMVGETNMLGYRDGRKIVPFSSQDVGELLGMTTRTRQRFLSKMFQLRLLQRVETKAGAQFYVNPMYFMANGQRLSLDLFLLFRNDLADLLPRWVMEDFLRQAQAKGKLL